MQVRRADGQRHFMQVVHSLKRGGSERLACDLAQRVNPARLRASVCAVDCAGPLIQELERALIPTFVMRRRPGFDWRLIPRLHRVFRTSRVDIVLTHHLTQLIYSALGARLSGAMLFHVEHEYFSLIPAKAQRRLRILARLCERVIVVGDEIREFLLSRIMLPPSKVTVIRNGVDLARYHLAGTVTRRVLGLPDGCRLIGHVARLEADKDQATLLRAFALIVERHPEARLIIVGDGSLRSHLQGLAESLDVLSRVHFLGLRGDVPDLLPHFEVFVLSSVREGLPLALLEAMASARPVVATGVGDIPTVMNGGLYGITAPPGDAALLAKSVESLLERPEAAAAIGRSARQRVESKYSLAETTRQYEALFETIPSGPRR